MGRFVVGLIIGIIVGGWAVAANPGLPQELRAQFESLTGQITDGAGQTANEPRETPEPQ
jgi:hypothetical protein